MSMKVLVLQHSEGSYDDYQELTDATYLVPNKFTEITLANLRKEWQGTFIQDASKKKPKLIPTISFEDWLATRYKRLDFVLVCD
jgi:hypothetical protein